MIETLYKIQFTYSVIWLSWVQQGVTNVPNVPQFKFDNRATFAAMKEPDGSNEVTNDATTEIVDEFRNLHLAS